jgi:large subunit ribosomal protein L33
MAKTKVVELVALACTQHDGLELRNYTTTKNRRNTQGKLELKKYCPRCRTHTTHREARVK